MIADTRQGDPGMSTSVSLKDAPSIAAGSVAAGSSDLGLASATQRTLEGAQLARLAAQLKELGNTRDLIRALGEDPDCASQLICA